MKLKLMAGVAAVAMIAAGGASAQPINGWYGALDLGYHWPEGIDATSEFNNAAGRPHAWTFASDDDWAGFARLGYRFNPNWRAELEIGYRPGEITSVRGSSADPQPIGLCTAGVIRTAAAPNCGPPSGEITSWTAMVNVIYDIAPQWALHPFVGVGAGINHVSVDVLGQLAGVNNVFTLANPGGNAPYQNLRSNDEDTVVAYQALAGLAWEVNPNLAVDLTYRFLSGSNVEFGTISTNVGPAGGAVVPLGVMSGNYNDSSLTLGLRWAFGSAPPPPPPPPLPEPEPEPEPLPPPPPPPAMTDCPNGTQVPAGAECPREARQFIVYFPWDEYYLTSEAQTVVQEAANYAASGNATQVVVVGHADTSGSAAYNVRLSERRAKTVSEALVSLGVDSSKISADWRGETQNAVPTPDGVREPLNRRTTIDVNF